MKKKLGIVLATLTIVLAACGSGSSGSKDTFVIGIPELNGSIFPGFGNSTYDTNIRNLIFRGVDTTHVTPDGKIEFNDQVLTEHTREELDNGNVLYTLTINDDILFSDGSTITAEDYVAYYELTMNPAMVEAGSAASDAWLTYIVGAQDYIDGVTKNIAGINVVDETTWTVELNGEKLPYYYETDLLTAWPYDVDTYREADGSYDPERIKNEYLKKPINGAGAYVASEYVEGSTYTLTLNENYYGNFEGKKPTIPTIVYRIVPSATDLNTLIGGEIDFLGGVVDVDKINTGKADDNLAYSTYPRNGFGYLAFHTDMPVVSDERVRQSIDYMIDKDQFLQVFLGGYGDVVYSFYAKAQWEVETSKVVPEELNKYEYNPEKAIALLEEAGWTFNETGGAYTSGIRYNAAGQKLSIDWAQGNNEFGQKLAPILLQGAEECGMEIKVDILDFNVLLESYYYANSSQTPDERKYEMFNLAMTFSNPNDATTSLSSKYYDTWQNATQLNDPELDAILEEMYNVTPTDDEAYLKSWEKLEVRMNELCAYIPLYSNEYHDFYVSSLQGYEANPYYYMYDYIPYLSFK